MKKSYVLGTVLACVGLVGPATAQTTVAEMVLTACEPEVTTFCSQVTPGDGRLMACFLAHEDKLSNQCIGALYDGMVVLDAFVDTVAYVATQCEQDIDTTCADAQIGDGSLAGCLIDNRDNLTAECVSAIDEVDLRRE